MNGCLRMVQALGFRASFTWAYLGAMRSTLGFGFLGCRFGVERFGFVIPLRKLGQPERLIL